MLKSESSVESNKIIDTSMAMGSMILRDLGSTNKYDQGAQGQLLSSQF